MSSFVLLRADGTLSAKLSLVSLPTGYQVPSGQIISWQTVLQRSSSDPMVNFSTSCREPIEAFFYLGSAWAQVTREGWDDYDRSGRFGLGCRYGIRQLIITVQGPDAADVIKLRDRILKIIASCVPYEVSNDLNPKPKRTAFSRFKQLFGH